MLVGLPGGVEGGCVVVVVEEGCLEGGFEGCPVAANDAVMGYQPEHIAQLFLV